LRKYSPRDGGKLPLNKLLNYLRNQRLLQQLLLFLAPYFYLARTGTYALLQNLEAFDVSSVWFGPYFDIKGTYVSGFAVLYMIFIFFTAFLNVISTIPISKKLTLITISIWLIPGFLSVFNIYLIKPDNPEIYHVGTGSIGTIWGIIVNALLCVIFGWSITNILIHIIKSDKKIKPIFDHVWYMIGLSAIIFYVVDLDIKNKKDSYIEAKNYIEHSFSLITQQSKILNSECINTKIYETYPNLCNSIYDIYSYSITYLTKSDTDREYSKKPTIMEISKYSNVNLDSLKIEVADLNDRCKKSKINDLCIPIDWKFMQYDSDLAIGNRSILDLYAFPLYLILKGIDHEWKPYVRYLEKENEYEKIKNIRWVLYIFISTLVGVKLATSTRDLFSAAYKPTFRIHLKSFYYIFFRTLVLLKNVSLNLYSFLAEKFFKLINKIINFQSSLRKKSKNEDA